MKKILTLLFTCISVISFAQDLNLGLRAYYPFNGNANDASGNNNNPVFNNATLTSDQNGNANSAYHFNGIDNYMKIPNSTSLNMGTSISICAKVRATGFYLGSCENNMLVAKGDGDFIPGTYNLRFADPVLGCTSNPPTNQELFYGGGVVSTSPYVELNKWYSVVCTYDGTTANIYVDCVLRGTNVTSQNAFQTAFDLYLGHLNNAQYPYWLNGDLDEVRIYDRALTQDEVNLYGGCSVTNCNNWLKTQVAGESVKIGDLDVSGDQITVEAQFNRTAPYTGGYIYGGDIVSKHGNPSSVNYLLRPNDAEITTTNGYYVTPPICEIELNKNYHVAMVYDGSTLKFYRDGFLMSQVAATGNLFQNDYITTIGDWANYITGVGTNFQGTINEVRIWNVARTQAQVQSNMNTSLPNPTTQPGLLAYYTFDNLTNKQGNATWNGTLTGAASINNINPICSFVADSCVVVNACNNWLNTPSANSYAGIGDLDIPGNTVTVEAEINRTQPYLPGGGDDTEGDVVSKHVDPSDVNYLLRPNHAYITTTNGYFGTPDICDLPLNKTYHIAMVYDGATLKFYRDGFLMSQVNATGNLIQNNWNTQIGHYAATIWNTQFLGYINEVRIWNVARTQSQIQAYMNTSLPNPATQPGLLAYYTFDDLLNKQGNTAWNGTLFNGASINNTNPNCTFLPDSCSVTQPCNLTLNTNITDTSICYGASVQLFATGNATDYSWDPPAGLSDPAISNPVATPNTDAVYTVTGTLGSCIEVATINIHVFPSPFANAGPDKNITTGDQVMLDGSGSSATSILWTPANTLTGANSLTPIAHPAVTTIYTLTITDNNNCIAIDEAIVFVKDAVCSNPPDPINAFTPNGDGKNDKWLAYTGGSCTGHASVSVYNRYGSLVYQNFDYQNDWEGTYKGKTLPDGTYYYVNTYKLLNGRTVVIRGDVTILR